ncbi:MAG: hypothetical protein Q4G16_03960 [Cruoricaptor ignavus]|nr:hypothetical protein [Cruoricaptor ignavus]
MEDKRKSIGKLALILIISIFLIYQGGYAIGKFMAHWENSKQKQ